MKNNFISNEDVQKEEELSFLDNLNRLIQLILNDNTLSIYTVLDKASLEDWKKSKLSRKLKGMFFSSIGKSLYFLLLIVITGFLVSEAITFYADNGIITTKTYIKAILTEVCFIFLSGYRSIGKIQTGAVFLLRVSVFGLMLFVITSETFLQGTKTVENTNSIAEQVKLLKEQIKAKEEIIEFYRNKNWGVRVIILTKEKDEFVKQLMELKRKQADGANTKVSKLIKYKSYGKMFFRVLLLFISMLVTRRMFKF